MPGHFGCVRLVLDRQGLATAYNQQRLLAKPVVQTMSCQSPVGFRRVVAVAVRLSRMLEGYSNRLGTRASKRDFRNQATARGRLKPRDHGFTQ